MSTANSSFSSSSSPSSEKLEHQEPTNNRRRIRTINDVNDESRTEGWRVIGAEIEIANEIDTISEVGYLYYGLNKELTSEMVKKDRKREEAQKNLELERSKESESDGVDMVAPQLEDVGPSEEEEEACEEIGERDSEVIDVVGTSQGDEIMEVTDDERTYEEKVLILSNLKKTNITPSPLLPHQPLAPFWQNLMMQRPLLSLFPPVAAPIQMDPMDLSVNSAPMEEEEDGEKLEEDNYDAENVGNGDQMLDFVVGFGDEEEMDDHYEEEQEEGNFGAGASSEGEEKIVDLFAGHPDGLKAINRAMNYNFLHATNGLKTRNKYKRFIMKNTESLKATESILEPMYEKYFVQKQKEKERRRKVRAEARTFNNRPERLLFRPF
ncbi:hypothetical protein GCK72_019431 [Caenorhabditis remanei]|uniref:Uncharacterized protein n=1 Tax=Caenorhabditis remanei TaxID=31234 RepID=A0A6A5GDR7_CAERE|nr:hypothetical protein GCK72_019431 [Caenorhabditis remanei]KAF1752876.1 hypothetical protein GCK72_019431 [Caenorhabditis remanei]